MIRRELLKGLLALPLLAIPLPKLDKFAGLGTRICGTETGRLSYNYAIQAARAEKLAAWGALHDVIITTEMCNGKLVLVDVRNFR